MLADHCSLALQELHRRHARAVVASATRVLRDHELAGDVSQDVFVGLWRQPARHDAARGPLGPFLCLQARRRAIDVRRATAARNLREERAARCETGRDSDSARWHAVVESHLREAVAALQPAQRRPIQLAFFNGHSYREVADLLGEPEGTIKSRIRAGLLKLRTTLATAELPEASLEGPLRVAGT
jgi:RNA polymerase sigma-70 factor (ECF subfamily)